MQLYPASLLFNWLLQMIVILLYSFISMEAFNSFIYVCSSHVNHVFLYFWSKKEGTIKLKKVLIGFLNTNHIIHSCYVDNFSNLYSPVIQSMLCNALVIDIKTLSEKCESIQQLPSNGRHQYNAPNSWATYKNSMQLLEKHGIYLKVAKSRAQSQCSANGRFTMIPVGGLGNSRIRLISA